METTPHVLVFDADARWAEALDQRLRPRGLRSCHAGAAEVANAQGAGPNRLAVIRADQAASAADTEQLVALVEQLVAAKVPTLVCGAPDGVPLEGGALLDQLAADVDLDEIVGRLTTLAHYAPMIAAFERELRHLRRLGEQLNHYFNEIDQEMRLAGRLQRDFLPRQLPELPPYGFHIVYRPASWVSGDMYDVFRIDEQHVGVFIADAMGHGVAAGLLTMFMRQALVPKRIEAGGTYTIATPAEALGNLHECLVRQRLPNCQFVTAAYGIINTDTGELRLARAGHPYALHIAADGTIGEIRTDGSLLGLGDLPTEFEETSVMLAPGEKLVLYTDGVEDALLVPRHSVDEETAFTAQLQKWARQTGAGFVQAIEEYLDHQEGSLHPADDVTVLAIEVHPTDGQSATA